MFTKHFLKGLMIFLLMIILGLIGVFLVSYFDQNNGQTVDTNNAMKVAK